MIAIIVIEGGIYSFSSNAAFFLSEKTKIFYFCWKRTIVEGEILPVVTFERKEEGAFDLYK